MTTITRPLDAAAAHSLQAISAWAAEELAARISTKAAERAQVGYSNQSCSTYVDCGDFCIRISDHDAMSYNRTGDFAISLRPGKFQNAAQYVRLTAIYEAEEFAPIDFDEDGEVLDWDCRWVETENPDAEGAEFKGWRVDIDSLSAAVDAAANWMEARLA